MSYEAVAISVLIASPGDTLPERDRVEKEIYSWNRDRSRASKVVLVPLRYEFDAVSELGSGDGQSVINRQLVENSDIVVGIFHSRLGSATPRADSGTAEEIGVGLSNAARVHVYFSEMPHPADVDASQLEALRRFRGELRDRGLVGTYVSFDDLAAKVRTALERDVEILTTRSAGSEGSSAAPARAILRFKYAYDREPVTDARGRVRMRSRRERLEVENLGDAVAEDVEFTLEAADSGAVPEVHGGQRVDRVRPHDMVSFPVLAFNEMAERWALTVRWREGDKRFEDRQTLTAL